MKTYPDIKASVLAHHGARYLMVSGEGFSYDFLMRRDETIREAAARCARECHERIEREQRKIGIMIQVESEA